jgi:hypothetical protein
MSRVIRLWVKDRAVRHRIPGCPLWSHFSPGSPYIGWLPPGGVIAYFIAFYDNKESDQLWLKVIYDDQAGWVYLGHISKIQEIDQLPNGEIEEKQVFPLEELD